ncbi:K02A2.6-like [Cordylochernes scorpioides]|uniref:K02A2.6-like n=1 Tax=Cordylochernes scorpioides TaxID=51811 RepID=A0ABY6LI11_9ARAC|nr:K02A2.6-like [Cordylochernes scorpioides]
MAESSMNIQKFDGNNFTSWKYRIICILEGKDLDGFIKEVPPKDEKITGEWKRRDAQARGIITCAMDDTQVSLILTCKTNKEIWTALHSRYEGNINRKCIEAKNNVSRLTMKKEETWEQYLLRAEKLLQEANILGGSIEDEEFITAFIRGLPPKYNLVSMQFDNYPDATISDIRRIFELHEERNKNNKDENAAYNMGHKFNKNFKKNSSDSNRERKPKCFICQKFGHKAAVCWFNPVNKRKENNQGNSIQTIPKQTFSKNKQYPTRASLIGENHNQETAMNLSSPEFINKCKWILDSGATSHMSTDINLMDDLQDYSRKITLPDDRFIKSNGIGTVEIYKDDNHLLTLKEVLYVPELNNNLISVSKIAEDEKQIIFDENGARIIDNNGSSIITAKREDNIYTIDACANIKLEENVFKTQENNWKIWHKRLAHINENYMNMMLKDSMVYGFSCSPINNLEPCITCIQSKFTRLPFKEIDSKQSTKPLDLIHWDLIGPFQHESIGRAIYVLNIVDNFSRKIFPKFLKSKLETFAKLKEFIELIENIKGTKIKRIRSDNGGDFTNRQLSSYLIEKGIEHQFTTFYSPSQNGIVERANRSLIEGTRALLIESQLLPKFWAEAMNTYSYIKNRTPHKRNDKTTPEELFTGKKLTIKHLKVFGCRAEYWIPKLKRYKFEKITKSGIFVGYSNKRKDFRICDPKNYAITETRDVSFIEKEKGAELLSNEVKAELPDHVLIDLNFCHKNGQKEEEPIHIHQGNVPESTSNEPDEDKNDYNLRPTPEQGFYYESSLSDEDTSQDDTTSDPTYHPVDSVMKVDSLPIIPTNYEEAINSPDKEKWVQAMKGEIDSLNNHKESLRDRFVVGIIDTSTQKKLLQEEKLTFDGALDIALSAESADNDLHNIKGSENVHQSPQHLHAINNTCKHCGPIKGIKCHLDVKADFIPKFYKFRQVPFALKQLVENEIDKLVDLNILSPIDKSDCASPLVCVAKPNGQIRLCADFKKSLNPYLEDVKYPIPNIDSVLSNFQGKKLFTKLDLSKAYHQIEMDDISKKYLVVSTHKGLYKYNRLAFGIKTASEIFQKTMESFFSGINDVYIYFDDILIASEDLESHLDILKRTLNILKENNFTINKNKCLFVKNEIEYLGHKINEFGIYPLKYKLACIKNCPVPKNITEFFSFLGFLSFYSKFLPNLSDLAYPLYNLLKKNVKWSWNAGTDRSFNSCKNALDETTCLSHYSLNLPLILSCDASQVGIGATLSHLKDGEERPVCIISRTLNVHERKYSQVEREGLAIVFAVNKLKNYLFGRKFTIYTDHKPLITIFGDKTNLLPLIANRLHRWALTLSNFSFEIKYKKGKDNIIPDFLSRFPEFQESNLEYNDGSGEILLLNTSIIDHVLVAHETQLDRTLFKLYKIIETGELPSSPNDDLIPYLKRIDDFTILQKCIFLENRMVIPKMMARSSIWWPGMDSSIEIITKNCRTCLSNESLPPQSTEISEVPSTSAYFCINFMRNCIARYGFPQVVVSDNGPPFFSSDFGDFLSKNGISHVTSPPYHPKSNGQAEVSVREVKKLLKKQLYENEQVELDLSLSRALFFIRTDVNIRKGTSPAELFFGRKIRSRLSVLSKEEVKVSKVNGQYVNSKFKVDETVKFRWIINGHPSCQALKHSPQSFEVVTPSGNKLIRNQQFIRPKDGVNEKRQLSLEPIPGSPKAQHLHYDSPTMEESSTTPIQRSSVETNINQKENATASAGISSEPSGRPRFSKFGRELRKPQ